jgi:hypothetical protein
MEEMEEKKDSEDSREGDNEDSFKNRMRWREIGEKIHFNKEMPINVNAELLL